MKKLLSAILTVSIIVSTIALAGCRRDDDGLVTIVLWYGAAVTEAGPPPRDWPVLQRIRDELNINLVLSSLPSSEIDQDVRINAAGAGNVLPDLFMVRRGPFMNLVNMRLIAPVDHLYEYMPIRSAQRYTEESRRFTTVNGRSYGFASPGAAPRNEGLLIRADWLENLGLDIPVTTDDFLNVMRAFTFGDPDGNGQNDTWGFGAFIEHTPHEGGLGRRFDPIFGAFGVPGTWDLTYENQGLNIRNPAYFEALSFVRQMVEEGLIIPGWESFRRDCFRQEWRAGRFGIMREQNAAFAAQHNYRDFDLRFPEGRWIVIDPPIGPHGHQSVGVHTPSFRIYAVSARALINGKGQYIARLLEWMTENYFLLGWGTEGDNFVFDDDGIPTVVGIPDPSRGFDEATMQRYTQLRNKVFYNNDVELTARFPVWTTQAGRQMSALWTLREMQDRPWTPNAGADALPLPNADVERFYNQGIVEFALGIRQLTWDAWQSWLAEFDSDRVGGAGWENEAMAAARDAGFIQAPLFAMMTD
ncbi:MAG: ABC transporter substrate-binding protein [Treponema sp.]|nr:ABC transporter substrate-binding protein [Treponema sp.]